MSDIDRCEVRLFIQEMSGTCGDHLRCITEVAAIRFELTLTPEMQAVDRLLAGLAAALDQTLDLIEGK